MHILIVKFLQMVTDRANTVIANKYKVHTDFSLSYLDLSLARSKGQGQGHMQFHCQYLMMTDNRANIAIANK